MGCTRSKQRTQSIEQLNDEVDDGFIEEVSPDDQQSTPGFIEKVYEHSDDTTGNSTKVVRTSYVQEKLLSQEETTSLLEKEAMNVLKNELKRAGTLEEACRRIKESALTTPIDDQILKKAVEIVKDKPLTTTSQLSYLLRDLFSKEQVEYCMKVLYMFCETKASNSSLLKIIHEKLANTQPEQTIDFANLQLDGREHENIQVTVKKSVKRRSVTMKELEERGLKQQDMIGKELYIVTKAPKGLDENLKAKTEEIMDAVGSICPSSAVVSKSIGEIAKIMEAHKQFSQNEVEQINTSVNDEKSDNLFNLID